REIVAELHHPREGKQPGSGFVVVGVLPAEGEAGEGESAPRFQSPRVGAAGEFVAGAIVVRLEVVERAAVRKWARRAPPGDAGIEGAKRPATCIDCARWRPAALLRFEADDTAHGGAA